MFINNSCLVWTLVWDFFFESREWGAIKARERERKKEKWRISTKQTDDE